MLLRWGAAFLSPKVVTSVRQLPAYLLDWRTYKKLAPQQNVTFLDSYPCLADRVMGTPFDPHYFFQAAWLARQLNEARPSLHVDIGSSVMMVNVLSAQVKTVFVDYRPLRAQLSNLSSIAGDVIRLPFRDACIVSLSCLHVIEHIGLGRYGDPLNPAGSHQAAVELQRVLRPGGRLFLSVPVGRERVCFNAHRVHAPRTIESFLPALGMESFSLVDDARRFKDNVSFEAADNLEYGCGMFEFVKARG
jgi:SAM-dependent methyltransferase